MKPIGKEIQNVVSQVRELTWCHAIWWEMVDAENRSRYARAFGEYPTYFVATVRMMQEEVFIIIYRLFDRRPDVISFRQLIDQLKKNDLTSASELERKIHSKEGFIEECKILRNKVHAHRDSKLTPEDVYKSVVVNNGKLERLIELCYEIAAILSQTAGKNSKEQILQEFNQCRDDAVRDTRRLLEALNQS